MIPVCHGLTRPQQRCRMLAVGIPTGIMLLLHCFHVFSKTDTQIYHWWNLSIDCLVGARTSAHHSSFSLLTITQELIAKLRRFWPRDVSTSWWRFLTQGRQPSGFPRQWWGRFHQDAQYVWSYPLYVFILMCQHACNHIAIYVYYGRKLCMTVCVESCWTHTELGNSPKILERRDFVWQPCLPVTAQMIDDREGVWRAWGLLSWNGSPGWECHVIRCYGTMSTHTLLVDG